MKKVWKQPQLNGTLYSHFMLKSFIPCFTKNLFDITFRSLTSIGDHSNRKFQPRSDLLFREKRSSILLNKLLDYTHFRTADEKTVFRRMISIGKRNHAAANASSHESKHLQPLSSPLTRYSPTRQIEQASSFLLVHLSTTCLTIIML